MMDINSDPKEAQAVAPWIENSEYTGRTLLEVDGSESRSSVVYLKGSQFYLVLLSIAITLFLTNLEVPVVTTSIATITDELGGFDRATWIVSAYLIGYVGILIIWVKLSDIFGRKIFYALALLLFIVFSGACSAAQTLTQLIIFRAIQGVGGGGCFAICNVVAMELVPEAQYAGMTAFVSTVYSISLLIGPIVGGAISKSSHWRWVFLLNVPATLPALMILIFFFPRHFPHHGDPSYHRHFFRDLFSARNLARVDLFGVIVLWLGTMALVAALEEAGMSVGWNSAFVITFLVISGLLLITFLIWERYVTRRADVKEPVFPWRFVTNRAWIGILLCALFQGGPWISVIFQLPQRFQVINGTSPIGAGLRIMPFTAAAPVGSILAATIAKKGVTPIYMILGASVLQVVGYSLLSTLPLSSHISTAQYGYQVIAGFAAGVNGALLILLTPLSVEPRDRPVAMGSFGQFRFLGGAVGLAIVNTAMDGFIKPRLAPIISQEQIRFILKSAQAISELDPKTRGTVASVLTEGYNLQFKIMAGLAAGQILGTFLMWRKKQIRA